MDLDWTILYDQLTILSQTEIRQKTNKFYESFYPMKLKKLNKPKIQLQEIQRGGFFGGLLRYVNRVLSNLSLYLEAEYFLSEGKLKDDLKLSIMFVDIENQNLKASLRLEKTVFILHEAIRYYHGRQHEKKRQKGYLQIKMLCMLKRLFEFFYSLHYLSPQLQSQGYRKIYGILQLNSIQAFEQSKKHFKLYPQISQMLITILKFFGSQEKPLFDFHSHIMEEHSNRQIKSFSLQLKKLFSWISNNEKQIFLQLSDERFLEYLKKCEEFRKNNQNQEAQFRKFQMIVQQGIVQNYFRSEEEMNSIVAEEENFLQSIMIPQIYRGTPQWKIKVIEQMINLSSQDKTKPSILHQSKTFRISQDFPFPTK